MNIYEAITATMAKVGAIGKTSKNTTQGFMFRGIDAVMNALQPAMLENHIFVVPEVLEQTREERINAKGTTLLYSILKIKYTFYAEDGTSVSAVVIGEGMDTGDKASNKAMSIGFKYACFQVFCIPTEEMKDPDIESHEVRSFKQDKAEQIAKQTISEAKVNTLMSKCEESGVNPADICGRCNVKEFSQLTEKQFAWIAHNWTKEFAHGE